MIEIVYKDEKQRTEDKTVESLPKNIRQIGEPDSRLRVYMEDFASTYLQKTGNFRPDRLKICVLYGKEREKDGQPVLFVQSAARLEVQEIQREEGFREPDWKAAEGIRKKFFPDQDVLGWAVISPMQEPLLLEQVKTVHRHHFTGRNQILFWSDGGEKEEILSGAGAGELMNLNGYYIYYEENRSMREYMISHNPTDTDRVGEPEDQAVKEFRQAVARKRSARPGAAGQLVRVAAAACVVFAIAGVLRYTQETKNSGTAKNAATIVREQWEENSKTTEEEPAKETAAEAAAGMKTSAVNLTEPQSEIRETTADPAPADAAADTAADTSRTESAAQSSQTEPASSSVQTSASTGDGQSQESAAASDTATEETAAAGYRAYQVKSGDTISSISQAYYGNMGMVEEICSLNHIKEQDLIYTGQILLLP